MNAVESVKSQLLEANVYLAIASAIVQYSSVKPQTPASYNVGVPKLAASALQHVQRYVPTRFDEFGAYTYVEELTHESEIAIAVQVNGKLRGTFNIAKDSPKEEMEAKALELQSVKNHIEGKTIRKIIVVPNKIVNIVAN